jgi:hypothetical protein
MCRLTAVQAVVCPFLNIARLVSVEPPFGDGAEIVAARRWATRTLTTTATAAVRIHTHRPFDHPTTRSFVKLYRSEQRRVGR